jgi:hypothetical protein
MALRETGGRGSVYWVHLAQDMDQWRVLVNTVIAGSTEGEEFIH